MIGPEDFGERRPVNHTPTIALGVAALLLLVVGAMSYSDFVRKRYDKEYAEKEAQMMQRIQQLGYAPPANPSTGAAILPAQVLPGAVAQAPLAPPVAAVSVAPAVQASPALAAAAMTTEAGLAPPNDPEIEAARQSLAQARLQSQAAEERFQSLTTAPTAATAPSAPSAVASPSATEVPFDEELPPFLRQAEAERLAAEAVSQAEVNGDAAVTQDLSKVRQAVSRANSLGKVVSYDDEWGLVTFNAGSANGVVVDKRFAVRRGSELLGWVKVDKVFENESIAILVTKNRSSDTAAKPAPGDDLIDFELF
jgi:hypothetical protein